MTQTPPKNPYIGHNWFTLNICPDDKHQYFGSRTRHTQFKKYIHELSLETFRDSKIDYQLHYELSTPIGNFTPDYKGPRYHVHGIIRIRNKKGLFNWLNYVLPSLLKGNKIEVDTINEPQVWYEYCTKDQEWQPLEPTSNYVNLWKELLINPSDPSEAK